MKENIRAYFEIFLSIIFKFIPLNKKFAYFTSYSGQYNDNPKYISEMLHNIDSEIICIWEISEKSNEKELPFYILKVMPHTFRALFYKSRSKIVVDNYKGYIEVYLKNSNMNVKKFIFKLTKNKKKINISTWHGTPLKKITLDDPNFGEYNDYFSTSDGIVVGCDYTLKILQRMTMGKVPIMKLGTPRNDIFFKKDNELKLKLKSKLQLPNDKKIVLFAPTFRNDLYKSGILQMEQINFSKFFKVLKKKFGGDWVFVYRFHDSILKNIDWETIQERSNGKLYNGNLCDDMAEYLYVSDILITDYSSSIFDYFLTKRPCFLYCPDIDYYESEERGFYMNIRNLPSSFATNYEELEKNIIAFSQEKFDIDTIKFLRSIGNFENGQAAKKIASMIYENMN